MSLRYKSLSFKKKKERKKRGERNKKIDFKKEEKKNRKGYLSFYTEGKTNNLRLVEELITRIEVGRAEAKSNDFSTEAKIS